MSTVYAYSVIRYGKPDGTVVEYQPGEKLDVEEFGKERIARFLESGHAATYDVTKPQEEAVAESEATQTQLETKVADLQARLAEATKRAELAEQKATANKPSGAAAAKPAG